MVSEHSDEVSGGEIGHGVAGGDGGGADVGEEDDVFELVEAFVEAGFVFVDIGRRRDLFGFECVDE